MKANEINHEKYLNAIQSLVGTEMNVYFETIAKYGDIAGKCEVVSFQPYDEFECKTSSFKDTYGEVAGVDYGTIKVRFIDTKKYKNKTFTFVISLFTGLKYSEEKLFISTRKLVDGKHLQAYRFGFIEV